MILGIMAAAASGGETPSAMTAIASQTLSSTQTVVTFSSIPSTYDDLRLVIYDSGDSTYTYAALMQFNSDGANNYSETRLYGDASTFYSLRQSSINHIPIQTVSQVCTSTVDILSYSNTSNYKTALVQTANDRNGSGETRIEVGLWRSTSAISSIVLTQSGLRGWDAGSVFSLYGIKKAA